MIKKEARILLVCMTAIIFLAGCVAGGRSNIKLNIPSKYSTQSWFYAVEKNKKDVGIVFIHGKRGNPGTSHNDSFISNMRDLGYEVVAPLMPWSEMRGYEGTRAQGLEVMDAAVMSLKAERVVVIGHSMGAMAIFEYGAGKMSSKVIGLVSVAPGHDPNNADKLMDYTAGDAVEACEMVAAGKGKERRSFMDMNEGKPYPISASAEYYCTHFSTNEYPDSLKIVKNVKLPTFILSGSEDKLTWVYSHSDLYESLPVNNKNKYEKMSGNHLNVLYDYTDIIAAWIESL